MKEVQHKKLSRSSGITIPKLMRTSVGMLPGTAVDLTETPEGGILISKHISVCRFCGSPEKVVSYCNEEICAECAKKILEEAEHNA